MEGTHLRCAAIGNDCDTVVSVGCYRLALAVTAVSEVQASYGIAVFAVLGLLDLVVR